MLGFQRDGVGGQSILLNGVDICGHTLRHRVDQGDTDYAYGTCKRGECGTSFFGEQILQRQTKGHSERHGGFFEGLFAGGFFFACFELPCTLLICEGSAVGGDNAVQHTDDTCGVALGKVGVVGDHDNKMVTGDFFEDIHDLYAGLGVQSAGRLVGKNDIGVVDQCAGNGHTLHLTARHLAGTLVDLLLQTYADESLTGSFAAFFFADARQGQSQLNVLQYRLMGDEVVALEHKSYRVVAVCIPVAVFEVVGVSAVDDEIALCVSVQTADDVEHGGLAAAGGAENRHKLRGSELKINTLEGVNDTAACGVVFFDAF